MRESSKPRFDLMIFYRSQNLHCSTIFFLLLWNVLIGSCSGYVDWIYPGVESTGLTFNYIDTVYFTWTSNITGPWMNLWCAPTTTSPQSKTYVYHNQVSTNGTNPQSFPYSEYYNNGICHMQLEDFAGDDFANTPTFDITSNDGVSPQTWGVSALAQLGGASSPTAVTSSSSTGLSSATLSTLSSISQTSTALSLSSVASLFALSTSTTLSPTISPAATTIKAVTPLAAPSPSSKKLTAATKAGISIGSILCALALVIIVLLCRNAQLKRATERAGGEEQHPNTLGQNQEHKFQDVSEIGEGAYSELNGVSRPPELHGVPRAELG